jgi:GntR family transcriptional regulator of arabinose operon
MEGFILLRYQSIIEKIIKDINSGIYPSGSKLPNSNTFCKKMNVSEITVRRAFTELANSGYVHRINGKGTYVGPSPEILEQKKNNSREILFVGRRNWGGFWTNMMLGAQKSSGDKGYQFLFYVVEDMREEKSIFLDIINRPTLSGIIFNTLNIPEKYLNIITQKNINYMIVDFSSEKYNYVDTDNAEGCKQAIRHLYEAGHRKIAFLAPRNYAEYADIRMEGYYQAMEELGISLTNRLVYRIRDGEFASEDIRELISSNKKMPFTAIQCFTDYHALKFINVCLKHGISIPNDIAVSGFGNIPEIDMSPIPLTSVDQGSFDEGRIACSLLIDKIEGRLTEKVQYKKKCKLIVRESTRPKVMAAL